MNTRISYVYRDAYNNKYGAEVILAGTLTEADFGRLMGSLHDKHYFVPGQVGLVSLDPFDGATPEELAAALGDEESPVEPRYRWHELCALEDTDEPASTAVDYPGDPATLPTAASLCAAFTTVTWDGED